MTQVFGSTKTLKAHVLKRDSLIFSIIKHNLDFESSLNPFGCWNEQMSCVMSSLKSEGDLVLFYT